MLIPKFIIISEVKRIGRDLKVHEIKEKIT
jgi:hypothetical protein